MSLVVDVAADRVRAPLGTDRVRNLARFVLEREKVREALVSIAFVSRRAIARLNRDHLGHSGPTDVISFALSSRAAGEGPTLPVERVDPSPAARDDKAVLGDIY